MNNKTYRFTIFLIFAYFLIRLLFFAVSINPYVPPDEIDHLGVSQHYAHSLLLPGDSATSYQYGPITHKPWLYYYIMGKFLILNVFPMRDILFLRLINIILGLFTILFSLKSIKLLTNNKLAHILFLVFITNTPMFSFLCASINYDNLANLLAVLAIYTLFQFGEDRKLTQLLSFGIIILLGTLTKLAFLPLAVVLALILIPQLFSRIDLKFRGKQIILSTVFALLAILSIQLYGHTFIAFKNINPGCEDILSTEQCMEWRIFARQRIIGDYRAGTTTKAEAISQAMKINHPAEKRDTLYLIEITKPNQLQKTQPKPKLNRLQYSVKWTQLMSQIFFGIMGHIAMHKQPTQNLPYIIIIFGSLGLIIKSIIKRQFSNYQLILLGVFLFYSLVLMQYQNYSNYIHSGVLALAVQGRYLFPVIVPLYLLMTTSMLSITSKWWQWFVLAGVALVFIWGDFPFFLSHATKGWYFQ